MLIKGVYWKCDRNQKINFRSNNQDSIQYLKRNKKSILKLLLRNKYLIKYSTHSKNCQRKFIYSSSPSSSSSSVTSKSAK